MEGWYKIFQLHINESLGFFLGGGHLVKTNSFLYNFSENLPKVWDDPQFQFFFLQELFSCPLSENFKHFFCRVKMIIVY